MLGKRFLPYVGVVLFTLLIVAGCSKKAPTDSTTAGPGTITGVVTKYGDTTVIYGVAISTNPATSLDSTNADGRYTISSVNAGNYNVIASKSGYINDTISVSVTADNTTTVNFALYDTSFVNHPPNVPNAPNPSDSIADTVITPILNWTCTDPDIGDTLVYDVYLETHNPPNIIVSSNQSTISFSCGSLNNNMTYYWKIIAKDNHGATTGSPAWSFTKGAVEWVSIPAGNFTMGSTATDTLTWPGSGSEYPQHTVYLDAYQIGKYELTNAQYKAFMDAGGYSNPTYWSTAGWSWRIANSITQPLYWANDNWWSGINYPNYPVIGVSWYEADAFCKWAGGNLPTEAQWEKAARGTDARYYPWGNIWDGSRCNSYENIGNDSCSYLSPIDFFPDGASSYGVYNMAGNINEFVYDWYSSTYYNDPTANTNPTGPSTGVGHIFRGGCWGSADAPCWFRTTARDCWFYPISRDISVGFRPAK